MWWSNSIKNNEIMQFCKCKCLGIDKTKEYIRYVGEIPKESLLIGKIRIMIL